ncbi:MAG: DUF3575 domain-containing protein [Bacteroidaceae bacterium]|nr:DUF3575 domain-containing protein [Bacteroidaceae bacterium]MBO7280119.1 DUF3575 domain-containing protein [Bacteroidaceae bacterium]
MLLLWGSISLHGQTLPDSTVNDSYILYYYCDRIDIDENYLDNDYQIMRIKDVLRRASRIDSITIYAYASPEGSPKRNKWLAEKRAEAARDFILSNMPDSCALHPENIFLRPMGENWEGLETELELNYHLLNRDKVLKIMRSNVPTETKKWRLKKLDNGYTYSMIIRHHMPRLRMATWICVHMPLPDVQFELPEYTREFPTELEKIDVPVSYERKTILALKSNLLYDAFTFANYSVEVPITKRFSLLYYHQFPWWRWGENNNKYCIRFLSIGAEARYWFNTDAQGNSKYRRDRLAGHFLGVYAESGKWDFQWKRDICRQGEHWSAGLSYGYAMPINKYLNLELSVSFGYASIPYRDYIPSDDYSILWHNPDKDGHWHYFGPTKAQVTLSVPITVKTKKKGGWQ